jgi:para-aminobenzoate synthetase/4-amino-4-deoxychorismate lyase
MIPSQFAAETGFLMLREGSRWRVYRQPRRILTARDSISLEAMLEEVDRHVQAGGEAAGLLRYEAGYAFEPRLAPLLARARLPLAWMGLYAGCEILDDDGFPTGAAVPVNIVESPNPSLGRDTYCGNVEAIRRLIEAGDVYQINFTYPLYLQIAGSAWSLFASLFHAHPTAYAAYMNLGSEQIVSLSPELFFRIEGGNIAVRPMKGTAPRGLWSEDDRLKAEELRHSEKERAENLMIVDLMRNDLGRICRTGSVKTPALFEVERLPSVWQMTSTVEGTLPDRWKISGVLRALFPPGSVTGAPKLRAMECIAELEPESRGAYTGILGYIARGKAQFSVAIRTIELRGDTATMGVGSGITWDSVPAAEWDECAWKAAFLRHQRQQFEIFETLLWQEGYTLLEEHVRRMAATAEYFGFPFDEARLRRLLKETAQSFSLEASISKAGRRVRAALTASGALQITHSELSATTSGRVGISRHRAASHDRFLFHKTTVRRLYDEEFKRAQAAGYDDVLFFNERGELTEGCIHNVFVVKQGVWSTPPVRCGLLPGVYRAKVLRENPEAREATLTIEDLAQADAIYLCNSVRGIYEVKLALQAAGQASG